MRGLIGDLLDAWRIETGALSVEPEPSEVAGLVDQARRTFPSGGGRHTLSIDLPTDLPRVMADRQRIAQVLNNLFSNAARHSPESSPIRVAAAVEGALVAVSVSDDGRGVPPDQLAHLFRKHPGVAGGARERGGGKYGLGLVICKGLVEAHGAASGPRAAGRAGARGSPPRSRPPTRPRPRRGLPPAPPARPGKGGRRRESLSWTTTRRRFETFGTLSPRPATPRW